MQNSPSIRHEKEQLLLSIIFEKDKWNIFTKKALLYQDIVAYTFTLDETMKSFRFTDLARWLMHKNIEFSEYYTGSSSNISITNRIAARRQIIQTCIDDLMELNIISKKGEVKAEKNNTLTPVYSFTIEGKLLAYLTLLKDMKIEPKNIENLLNESNGNRHLLDKIHELIQSHLSGPSCKREFASYFFKNLNRERNYLLFFILAACSFLFNKVPNAHFEFSSVLLVFDEVLIALLSRKYEYSKETYQNLIRIYFQSLDEIGERKKKIIIHLTKLQIQNEICQSFASEKLEEAVTDNNHDIVTVCLCRKCDSLFPIAVDFFHYISSSVPSPEVKCKRCSAQNKHLSYFVPHQPLISIATKPIDENDKSNLFNRYNNSVMELEK